MFCGIKIPFEYVKKTGLIIIEFSVQISPSKNNYICCVVNAVLYGINNEILRFP